MSQRRAVTVQVLMAVGLVLGMGVVFLAYALWDRHQDGPIIISSDPTLAEIAVEVRGAVATPGVYRLPVDARVGDLLTAAGGPTVDADLVQVNLARRLADEEIVQIPQRGSTVPATPVVAGAPTAATDARININTATAAELEQLPGIGEVLAGRIVAYRTEHGPFRTVDDLTAVQGLSERLVDEIRDLVTTGP